MLILQKIKFKNLLSYGNNFTEFNFTKHDKVFITGKNGKGKSTLITAVCYALFGKPYIKINKPQIINSINQKDLLVELDFSISNIQYKIVRGMKKNIFEVYENNKLIDQSCTNPDYQKILEEKILKTDFDTFKQVAILSTDRDRYVPFMDLKTDDRRKFSDKLLGIEIFQDMNVIVKQKYDSCKKELADIDKKIDNFEREIRLIESHIKQLESIDNSISQDIDYDIIDLNNKILLQTQIRDNLYVEYDKLILKLTKKQKDQVIMAKKSVDTSLQEIVYNIKKIKKNVEFFTNNSTCVTCKQEIGIEHKNSIIHQCSESIKENESEFEEGSKFSEHISEKLNQISILENDITSKKSEIDRVSFYINSLRSDVESKIKRKSEFKDNKTSSVAIADNLKKISDLRESIQKYIISRNECNKQISIIEFSLLILKDTGVKTEITKKYIPIFNIKINEYLSKFNFYINFEFDENFNEQIKSKNRDVFSYTSFSAGQKKRIDIAILFACLDICKMRSSLHTNVLFLDEIMDSGFDQDGIDDFMVIINEMSKEKNIITISPRGDLYQDKFRHVFNVEMVDGFSIMR